MENRAISVSNRATKDTLIGRGIETISCIALVHQAGR
jgi:hypothetical protein